MFGMEIMSAVGLYSTVEKFTGLVDGTLSKAEAYVSDSGERHGGWCCNFQLRKLWVDLHLAAVVGNA